MTKSILGLSQVVSETQTDPENIDPAQSAQIDDDLSDLSTLEKLESQLQKQELLFAQFPAQINSSSTAGSGKIDGELSVRTTLERLEIQFQKQELLNAQFSAKIKSNGDCLNSSIQDFRTSLQLIFKELKVMKQAQTNSPQICNNFQSKQGMNPSSEILGSAPQSGNGFATIPRSPSLDHHGFENIHIAPQVSYNQFHSQSNINSSLQTSDLFLHHKSMKLEFPMNNGSRDVLAWINQTKFFFRYHKLPDCENEYKLFDLMLEQNSKKISDKAVFIFDPGGSTFNVDGVFEIWPRYDDAQIIFMLLLVKLLHSLSNMELRTLTCAPTNVAITEVIYRVLKCLESDSLWKRVSKFSCYWFGDIVLLGNVKRLKIDDDLLDVYLDHRVNRLLKCLSEIEWRHHMKSLPNCLENFIWKFHHHENFDSTSFVDFVLETFHSHAFPVQTCLVSLCAHLPSSAISLKLFEDMIDVLDLLHSFEDLLTHLEISDKELEEIFTQLKKKNIVLTDISNASKLNKADASFEIPCSKRFSPLLNKNSTPSCSNKRRGLKKIGSFKIPLTPEHTFF